MTVTAPERTDTMSRGDRKAFNRDLAEWLRVNGLPATGGVWSAACYAGERDLVTLVQLARVDVTMPRRFAGDVHPAILEPGDFVHGLGTIVATAVDPDTGAWWLTVRSSGNGTAGDDYDGPSTTVEDVEVSPDARVTMTRTPRK